jgi:hypothetical protein
MRRVPIGIGIDGDRRNPHPARRLDHPAGDLATVRDEDFFEHFGPGTAPRQSKLAAMAKPPPVLLGAREGRVHYTK